MYFEHKTKSSVKSPDQLCLLETSAVHWYSAVYRYIGRGRLEAGGDSYHLFVLNTLYSFMAELSDISTI